MLLLRWLQLDSCMLGWDKRGHVGSSDSSNRVSLSSLSNWGSRGWLLLLMLKQLVGGAGGLLRLVLKQVGWLWVLMVVGVSLRVGCGHGLGCGRGGGCRICPLQCPRPADGCCLNISWHHTVHTALKRWHP